MLKGYDKKASQCTFVKDYVVVNLKKVESEYWDDHDWKRQGKNIFKEHKIY